MQLTGVWTHMAPQQSCMPAKSKQAASCGSLGSTVAMTGWHM